MNKKELIELGIEEDVAKKVIVLHGKGIEKFKSEVTNLTSENETLTTQLTEAGEKIESFKDMDIDAIKAESEGYKVKAEEAETKRQTDVAKLKFDHTLDGALGKAKAKNRKSVRALLKLEDLKLAKDGDSIDGLDAMLEPIITENPFLFDSKPEDDGEEDDPKITTDLRSKSVIKDSTVDAAREAAGLSGKEK